MVNIKTCFWIFTRILDISKGKWEEVCLRSNYVEIHSLHTLISYIDNDKTVLRIPEMNRLHAHCRKKVKNEFKRAKNE